MLDTRQINKQSVSISAVSGTIVKTHPKSFIRVLHINSPLAKEYFSEGSRLVALQVMNTHDGYVFAELVNRNDFEVI